MAYGPNLLDTYRQLGGMAGKVYRGMKPADLPVELPTKFELVINFKTAKALGIEVPTSILLRAPTRSSNEKARVHHAARRRGGAWPLAARAQQPERMRRIGVLMDLAADDPEGRARLEAFRAELGRLGWTDGGSVRIDIRWGAGVANQMRSMPRTGRAHAGYHFGIWQSVGRSTAAVDPKLPVVFASVVDPVGAGFVTSWRGPAATQPDSCCWNTVSVRSGLNCSRRLTRA